MPVTADTPRERPSGPAKWKPSVDEQGDLEAIDQALHRMRHTIAPDPYVLTIPQDIEPRYHHTHPSAAHQWLHQTPFTAREHEAIQYQTFIFHEPGSEIYVQEKSRMDESKPRPTSASTPNLEPKKKISFNTYRQKQNGATMTPDMKGEEVRDVPAKGVAVKGPIEKAKAETEEMLAAIMDEAAEPVKHTEAKNELKRKREGDASVLKQEAHPTAPSREAGAQAPPMKKARKTPPRLGPGDSNRDANETALPPRLSPAMPPKLSPLPPIESSPLSGHREGRDAAPDPILSRPLSPNLPPNIARALEAREQLRSASRSSNVSAPNSTSKAQTLAPTTQHDSTKRHKSPVPRNGFRANSSSPAVGSGSEDRRPPPSSVVKLPLPNPKMAPVDGRKPVTRPSLIVRMKYKKARRDDIKRILQMRPRPSRDATSDPAGPNGSTTKPEKSTGRSVDRHVAERKIGDPPIKGVAQRIGPAKKEKRRPSGGEELPLGKISPLPEPRARSDDEKREPPAKRRRPEPSDLKPDPSTPAPTEMPSPAPTSSAHKHSVQSTPSTRKDLLSASMKRDISQDSNVTQTPPAMSSTPVVGSMSQPNGLPRPPSSSQGSLKTPKQLSWEAEQKRFDALGRELKHAATEHQSGRPSSKPGSASSSSATSSSSIDNSKLAAVKAVESFLCYLLAFTCADEALAAAEPRPPPTARNWRTLTGFYAWVKSSSEPFPALQGLTYALGVVFHARILDITTQVASESLSREQILDVQAALLRAAHQAEARLDVDVLQDQFPRTWRQRSRSSATATAAGLSEKLGVGKLGGAFRLPIGLTTSPVRAARAGHSLLREWIEKENLDYKLKVQL